MHKILQRSNNPGRNPAMCKPMSGNGQCRPMPPTGRHPRIKSGHDGDEEEGGGWAIAIRGFGRNDNRFSDTPLMAGLDPATQ
jgi:hypothetical protein